MRRGVLAPALALLALSASALSLTPALALEATALVTQNGGIPQPTIAVRDGKLVVTQSGTRLAMVFSTSTLAKLWEKKLQTSGVTQISIGPGGWAAICYGMGSRVALFRASSPQSLREIKLADELQCTGIAVQLTTRSSVPYLWVGMPGDRKIGLFDPSSESLLRSYPVTGVQDIQLVGNSVFAANVLMTDAGWFAGLPFVMDARTGQTKVGNAAADTRRTQMKFGAWPDLSYTPYTDTVYYAMPGSDEILGFSASSPAEATVTRTKVGTEAPLMVSEWGQCLAVLGHDRTRALWPEWSILKRDLSGNLSEARRVSFPPDTKLDLREAVRQGIDPSNGTVFIAYRRGVAAIRGLFEGVDCAR